ncbi:MAG TPA: hypothetical protein PL193_11550 [Xanthobacteraceae bacterium]|nr:hypothetical protein [Xanthobacteraceae bacterium]
MGRMRPDNDNVVRDQNSPAAVRVSKTRRRKFMGPPQETWFWMTIDCLSSPNMRSLSRTARLVLDRLIEEHYRHRCYMNGHLIVTYADFVRAGARRQSIRQAIDELVATGLALVDTGSFASPERRRSSRYTLTFYSVDGYEPTNDWQRIMPQYVEARLALIRKKYRKRRSLRERYTDAA